MKAPLIEALPPCPFLPPAQPEASYRLLQSHGKDRGNAFFEDALSYGQTLWLRHLPARAILALARALYSDLNPASPPSSPMPYEAFRWICEHAPEETFLGNPRLSFQHQAARLSGPRMRTKRIRGWAAHHVFAKAMPHLPNDPEERPAPAVSVVRQQLRALQLPGEWEAWEAALEG